MITKWFLVSTLLVNLTGEPRTEKFEHKVPFDSRRACTVMADRLSKIPEFVGFTCIERVLNEISL